MAYTSGSAMTATVNAPHGMDARAIRHAYGNHTASIHDYGVYFYHTEPGIYNMSWSSFPSSVTQGYSFTVQNVVAENLGTHAEFRLINFFLTPQLHSYSGYYLGARLVGLQKDQYTKMNITFNVTLDIPPGDYYILADIGTDDNNQNRFAWTHSSIKVNRGAEITLTPSDRDFGVVPNMGCSEAQTIQLKNIGGSAAMAQVYLDGPDADHFQIVSSGSTFSLGSNGAVNIQVAFCPLSAGDKFATLVAAGGTGTNDASAVLTGSGFAVPGHPGPITGPYEVEPGEEQLYEIDLVPDATSYNWQYSGRGDILGDGHKVRLLPYTSGILSVEAVNSCGSGRPRILRIVVETEEHTLRVDNVMIAPGDNECFSASELVILASGEDGFFVRPEGSATVKAGEAIRMLPGTQVVAGGYLHAYIMREGDGCSPAVKHDADTDPLEDLPVSYTAPGATEGSGLFRVFPNPTAGAFTLELGDWPDAEQVSVEVYNTLGSRVLHATLPPERQHALSLAGQQPGIYIVRVIAGDRVGVERIVKR